MTQKDNIVQELNELNSSLANNASGNAYTVPVGYFEGLADGVLNRIKALEATDAKVELNYLSPLVNSISREMLYSVPAGFFNGIDGKVQQLINGADEPTAEEELRSISPLLGGLRKEMPFNVPEGYFETMRTPAITEAKPAKVISITRQKWFRYAVAAVITGFFAIGGYMFLNNDKKGAAIPVNNSFEWVKYNVRKVSTSDIDKFVSLTDDEAPVIASVETSTNAKDKKDVEDLIKDVPDKDIQSFLDDAVTDNADAGDDALMN